MRGAPNAKLREVRALAGVFDRDYAYDRIWVVFPLKDASGMPLFTEGDREAELVVRIYSKEGRVSWTIPDSIRARLPSP